MMLVSDAKVAKSQVLVCQYKTGVSSLMQKHQWMEINKANNQWSNELRSDCSVRNKWCIREMSEPVTFH